ncbi:hypothetical protein [Mucilaginibacter sp.]|uniref:hypothetical protein n=1 Tax=Mucilaginibacter sp. TaxID=1882438 RepID=UPI0032670CBB
MKTTKTNILRKALLAFALILAGSTISFAQCDKPVKLTSSVTSYINDKGEVERTKEEQTVIILSKTELTITPGDHMMNGNVTEYTCNWTTPFKDGKTIAKAVLTDGNNDLHVTITIEGKAGKVTLTFVAEEEAGKKIQVVADKFE